jgi:hypothetical protein
MKYLLIALTAVIAGSAVTPANAQSASKVMCFFQTDNSRLTGYYDICPDTVIQAQGRRSLTIVVRDDVRDSGGEGGGGGGGGR